MNTYLNGFIINFQRNLISIIKYEFVIIMTCNIISNSDSDMLKQSCLVISDNDLIKGSDFKSIDDIALEHVKFSYDVMLSSMVLYDGIFGQKVLKLRMQKVCRNGIGGYHHYT